jgi:nitroreductase
MQVLGRRASGRDFSARPLPEQVLSNLLWAANGVNRPESGRRTAASACNWQEIDLYVIRGDGAYRYDPQAHALRGWGSGDLRPATGVQAFVARAPLVLAYVADLSKMKGADEDGRRFYPACDTGYVSANVYLFCASEGLATVALISVDKPVLHERLGLRADQAITLTQPVGYPVES